MLEYHNGTFFLPKGNHAYHMTFFGNKIEASGEILPRHLSGQVGLSGMHSVYLSAYANAEVAASALYFVWNTVEFALRPPKVDDVLEKLKAQFNSHSEFTKSQVDEWGYFLQRLLGFSLTRSNDVHPSQRYAQICQYMNRVCIESGMIDSSYLEDDDVACCFDPYIINPQPLIDRGLDPSEYRIYKLPIGNRYVFTTYDNDVDSDTAMRNLPFANQSAGFSELSEAMEIEDLNSDFFNRRGATFDFIYRHIEQRVYGGYDTFTPFKSLGLINRNLVAHNAKEFLGGKDSQVLDELMEYNPSTKLYSIEDDFVLDFSPRSFKLKDLCMYNRFEYELQFFKGFPLNSEVEYFSITDVQDVVSELTGVDRPIIYPYSTPDMNGSITFG